MKKTSGKKSGFAEGRSNTGPSRSSISDKKKKQRRDPDAKANKRLAKLEAAKDDLADVLRDLSSGKKGKSLRREEVFTEVDDEGDGENALSAFKQDFGAIRKSIVNSGDDFNSEAAHRALLKTLFAMSLDLMPLCEVALRNSKKEQAAYALIAMTGQVKELATELKMLGNVENQGQFIKEHIIQPLFTSLLQIVMQQFMNLKNTVDTEIGGYHKLSPNVRIIKRQMDMAMMSLSQFLDASRDNICANTQSYLSGDMTFMQTNNGSENKGGGGKKRRRKNRDQ